MSPYLVGACRGGAGGGRGDVRRGGRGDVRHGGRATARNIQAAVAEWGDAGANSVPSLNLHRLPGGGCRLELGPVDSGCRRSPPCPTVVGMRLAPLALAAALLLALAGCVPTTAHPTASPRASATPVFASDAEALAAAEKAYAAYLKVSDEVASDGGLGSERFASVVTKQWLPTETVSASQLASSGRHQTGATTHSPLKLQQATTDSSGVSLVAYTCLNLAGTRILDAAGADVTPATRESKLSVEVSFRSSSKSPTRLLVDSNEPWSGPTFC